jgi:hypothetical protein
MVREHTLLLLLLRLWLLLVLVLPEGPNHREALVPRQRPLLLLLLRGRAWAGAAARHHDHRGQQIPSRRHAPAFKEVHAHVLGLLVVAAAVPKGRRQRRARGARCVAAQQRLPARVPRPRTRRVAPHCGRVVILGEVPALERRGGEEDARGREAEGGASDAEPAAGRAGGGAGGFAPAADAAVPAHARVDLGPLHAFLVEADAVGCVCVCKRGREGGRGWGSVGRGAFSCLLKTDRAAQNKDQSQNQNQACVWSSSPITKTKKQSHVCCFRIDR